MKTLDILTKPYNDEVLEFNKITGRYQLTLQYVKSLRDALPYRNDGITRQRIKDNSIRVYQYITNHSASVNRQVIAFLLERTENGRQFLIEALTSQIQADIEYAYNDIVRKPTLAQGIDREQARANQISLETENVIDDANAYFGFNLCVLVPFNWELFDLVRKYEG